MISLFFCISVTYLFYSSAELNERPIIGILAAQVLYPKPNQTAYIASSYVKFLESGGARVVPVTLGKTLEEYKRLFNSINGILFPGGSASIFTSRHQRAALIFYELAIEAKQKGDHFPIWGTCLGIELLFQLTSDKMTLSKTNTTHVTLPMSFTNEHLLNLFGHLDMKAFKVLLVFLLTAATTDSQSLHPGKCPQPSVQEDFDVTKYMGTWYEIEKLPAAFERGKCNQATYSLLADGTVKVRNAEMLSNGKKNTIEGVAKVKNASTPAILGVSFFKGVPDGPYWVLSTDYQSYSLVYSCTDYFLFHVDFAWILARSRGLTEDVMSRLHDKLTSAGVNINRLTVSDQTDCDQNRAKRNDRPIIGVLAQDIRSPKPNRTAYLAASYVKSLESAGARVVPVMINQTLEEYKKLFNSINGILYPGGSANIMDSGYQRSASIFYELAIEANKRGDYFPVWGTCLGYEQLTVLTSGKNLLSPTNATGVPLNLNFINEAKDSRMFKGVPAELIEDLASEPLTANNHKWSVSLLTHNTNEELKNFYKVISTSTDGNIEFVSTVEAYDYPIYGTQWHPEKNAFEWTRSYIPHSPSAVKTTFYMADFFVSEARKNFHRFESEEEESKALIYNYQPVYAGPNSSFVQRYYF